AAAQWRDGGRDAEEPGGRETADARAHADRAALDSAAPPGPAGTGVLRLGTGGGAWVRGSVDKDPRPGDGGWRPRGRTGCTRTSDNRSRPWPRRGRAGALRAAVR